MGMWLAEEPLAQTRHASLRSSLSSGLRKGGFATSIKKEAELTSEEKQSLVQLLESSQEISCLHCLIQSFLHLLCERKPELLNGWMKEARESAMKELCEFCEWN